MMKRTKKNKLIDITTPEQKKENAIKIIAFLYQLVRHRRFQELKVKHFVNLAINRKLNAIELLPDKESLIRILWKKCVKEFLKNHRQLIQSGTLFTLGCPQKNNWKTFHAKLNSCKPKDQIILPTLLYKTLLRELILNEKGCKPFWTPVYKGLSEKLSLHTETVYVDSDMKSLNTLSQKVEEESLLSPTNPQQTTKMEMNKKEKNQQNKNSQRIFFPSSISTHVDKWVKENTEQIKKKELAKQSKSKSKKNPCDLKVVKIRLVLTKSQKKIIKEWFDTSNYVYNNTIEYINTNKINMRVPCAKRFLRNKLVCARTRKNNDDTQFSFLDINEDNDVCDIDDNDNTLKENHNVNSWELNTPYMIRESTVFDVYEAYHTAYANINAGNIRKFEVKYRKKTDMRSIVIPHKYIKNIKNGIISLFPRSFSKDDYKIRMGKSSKQKYGNIKIDHDCRMLCDSLGNYWLIIPTKYNKPEPITTSVKGICGIDPGVRTFLTIYGSNGEEEIQSLYHTKIIKINERIDYLKKLKKINRRTGRKVRIRKRRYACLEQRKINITNDMHYKSINKILKTHDVIFLEDIKSHNIVKNNKNHKVNRSIMDMRFYSFKQKFAFKALEQGAKLQLIPAPYTSKTCSRCGNIKHDLGSNKEYKCTNCGLCMGRDSNASKNILMRGLIENCRYNA